MEKSKVFFGDPTIRVRPNDKLKDNKQEEEVRSFWWTHQLQ